MLPPTRPSPGLNALGCIRIVTRQNNLKTPDVFNGATLVEHFVTYYGRGCPFAIEVANGKFGCVRASLVNRGPRCPTVTPKVQLRVGGDLGASFGIIANPSSIGGIVHVHDGRGQLT